MERSNNYFSSYPVNKNIFESLTLGITICWEGSNEFNLLHHVGVVAKKLRAAAVETHEWDNITPGQGLKT